MGEIAMLRRGVHVLAHFVEAHLADTGLTHAEAHVLAVIEGAGAPSIGMLHRELALKRSTLTNVIDRLEKRRLVRRKVNPDDRRSFVVEATASGQRLGREITDAFGALERALRRETSAAERHGFAATLAALEAVVEQHS